MIILTPILIVVLSTVRTSSTTMSSRMVLIVNQATAATMMTVGSALLPAVWTSRTLMMGKDGETRARTQERVRWASVRLERKVITIALYTRCVISCGPGFFTHGFQMTGRVRTNIGHGQVRPRNHQHRRTHRRVRSGSRGSARQF